MENLQYNDRIETFAVVRHKPPRPPRHLSLPQLRPPRLRAVQSRLWCQVQVFYGRNEWNARGLKTFNIWRFVKTHNMVDKPRRQRLKEWSKLTQWNPCIRSSQYGSIHVTMSRGPLYNCNSESGLQVEYRVLCKANHWLKTLGSRCSICFDWLVLMICFENWFQHVSPTTSPNHSSQGFSTAFGKPASKFWTSQCAASCLDVLAMLASMVGFLCCSFNAFEAVEVDRVLQSSAILETVFACIRKATCGKGMAHVFVKMSDSLPAMDRHTFNFDIHFFANKSTAILSSVALTFCFFRISAFNFNIFPIQH